MFLHDAVADREAQTQSPSSDPLVAEERIVDAREIFSGEIPSPGISNLHVQRIRLSAQVRLRFSVPPSGHRIARVDKKIEKDLLQFARIAADDRECKSSEQVQNRSRLKLVFWN